MLKMHEGAPQEVLSVRVNHRYLTPTGTMSVEALHQLASKFLLIVEREYEKQQQIVLEIARQISPEKLLRRAKLKTRRPGARDVAKTRPR